MHNDISSLTVSQLSRRLQNKSLNPIELTEYFLARIEDHPDPSVFITIMREQALEAAHHSWQRWCDDQPLSILDGIPVAWKDLIDIKGVNTSAGSQLYSQDGLARKNALIVERLNRLGTVPLGKTNLTEFAYSGVGMNPHFGTPVIKEDYHGDFSKMPALEERHIPGGSSCGAAVGLSCGLTPISIGTDTSGSVRVPAALNGLVGHHSSPERFPTEGVFCLSSSLDTIGTLAKSVEDCLLMDCAMRGVDIVSEAPRPLTELKLIVPKNYICEDCDSDTVENFETAIEVLKSKGVIVNRCAINQIEAYAQTMEDNGALVTAEAYYGRRQDLAPQRRELIDPLLVTRLFLGERMSAANLIAILDARKQLHNGLMAHLSEGYILAMPTVPITAPLLKPLQEDADLFARTNMKLIRNTMIASIAGLCSLTLPTGVDQNRLSMGILFCDQPAADRRLLQFGLELSSVLQNGAV